jgi:hypothetical protein
LQDNCSEFFPKVRGCFHAADISFVVNADINFAAMSIGKTANPIEVIIVPTAYSVF